MQAVFEKIIEKLEEIRAKKTCNKEKCDTKELCRICVVDDAIEIVKQEVEQFGRDTNVGSNRWIPCSDRLPEDGMSVLVQDFEEYYEVSICETRNGVKGFSSGDWWTSANNYIAWQLLPKPFQKGE